MTGTTTSEATATERHALVEFVKMQREARGDHPALADVRRQLAAEVDALCAVLSAAGVDVYALLDDIDDELYNPVA